MNTKVLHIHMQDISKSVEKIQEAALSLREGGLVVFPTETVYGLGANILHGDAIRKIYQAKGRPSDNPLIVHISSIQDVPILVSEITSSARRLMETFWPGPLTIILPKSSVVSDQVSAGLPTVALRMPSHPVALMLIKEAGIPVAAPSANLSGSPSPTEAIHTIADLEGKVDYILDGGSCHVGLESTVIDLTEQIPTILRPGGITPDQLKAVLGDVRIDPALLRIQTNSIPKSPGLKYRHYAPKAGLIVVTSSDGSDLNAICPKVQHLAEESHLSGKKTVILATKQTFDFYTGVNVVSAGDRNSPESIAQNFFSLLRKFDQEGFEQIIAEGIEESGIGVAVMNRLTKASGHHVVRVNSSI